MRIRHKVNVIVSDDTAGKDKLFGLDDALAEVVLDGMQEVTSGQVTIDAGDTFSIPFGNVGDARGCFLKVTGDCMLDVNAEGQLPVRRGVTGAGSSVTYADNARVFLECGLTSLEVEVDAADAAITLTYVVWGDPVEASP
jgi:hypothetical protein